MVTEQMQERLNRHFSEEYYSSYLYLAMSAYCSSIDMNGFAHWFRLQAQEEHYHAMKFYDYILSQGGNIVLFPIQEPKVDCSSLINVVEKSLTHEQYVTKLISELMDYAMSENDHATRIFLQWFITEQVEEEGSVRDILSKLKRIEDSNEGLFLLDRELSSRTPAGE